MWDYSTNGRIWGEGGGQGHNNVRRGRGRGKERRRGNMGRGGGAMVLNEIELKGIGGQRKATECQGLLGQGKRQ